MGTARTVLRRCGCGSLDAASDPRGERVSTVFVSFHGGSSASSVNNMIGFADGASPYLALGPSTTPAFGVLPALSELRAFILSPGGEHLYVANGSKDTSQVLRFHASSTPGTSWSFDDVYADK